MFGVDFSVSANILSRQIKKCSPVKRKHHIIVTLCMQSAELEIHKFKVMIYFA